jgi:hypothetical protein
MEERLPLRVVPSDHAVCAELQDGEAVIVDTQTAFYFGLNRAAAFLWKRLCRDRPVGPSELARALCGSFEVPPDEAAHDAEHFLARMIDHRLARTAQADAAPSEPPSAGDAPATKEPYVRPAVERFAALQDVAFGTNINPVAATCLTGPWCD